MITRWTGALLRGTMVAGLIATPSMILPLVSADTAQLVAFLALAGAVLTVLEYGAAAPCLVEFRGAAPINRLRFAALLMSVACVSMIIGHHAGSSSISHLVFGLGALMGAMIDLPFTPVGQIMSMLPDGASAAQIETTRAAMGMVLLIFGGALITFRSAILGHRWPRAGDDFNVWVNLPTFDPTGGGDVVRRLHREARFNFGLAICLPFILPLILSGTSGVLSILSPSKPQTMVWVVTAWAFFPFSLAVRGFAMRRVAQMIAELRRSNEGAQDTSEELLTV